MIALLSGIAMTGTLHVCRVWHHARQLGIFLVATWWQG